LPPGTSVLFPVPHSALKRDRVVYIDYGYEWEHGQHFSSNLAPVHRVEFWSYRLPR